MEINNNTLKSNNIVSFFKHVFKCIKQTKKNISKYVLKLVHNSHINTMNEFYGEPNKSYIIVFNDSDINFIDIVVTTDAFVIIEAVEAVEEPEINDIFKKNMM